MLFKWLAHLIFIQKMTYRFFKKYKSPFCVLRVDDRSQIFHFVFKWYAGREVKNKWRATKGWCFVWNILVFALANCFLDRRRLWKKIFFNRKREVYFFFFFTFFSDGDAKDELISKERQEGIVNTHILVNRSFFFFFINFFGVCDVLVHWNDGSFVVFPAYGTNKYPGRNVSVVSLLFLFM